MKKKVLSMMLAGAMTVSMLAGCGAGSDEAATTDNTAADTKTETAGTTEAGGGTAEASGNPVTLRTVSMFGGTDPNKETYEAINKEFMEQYDYITIEDNSQTSDEEWKAAVNADFSVGNEPDVIQFFTDATAVSLQRISWYQLKTSAQNIRTMRQTHWIPHYRQRQTPTVLSVRFRQPDTGKAYTATRICSTSTIWNFRQTGLPWRQRLRRSRRTTSFRLPAR